MQWKKNLFDYILSIENLQNWPCAIAAGMKEQETQREKRISGTGWSSEYLWANT